MQYHDTTLLKGYNYECLGLENYIKLRTKNENCSLSKGTIEQPKLRILVNTK